MRTLLFPSLCLHCNEPCERDLCLGCSATLLLLDPEEGTRAAALPYREASSTLLNALALGETRLAPALAGFLIAQLDALRWPSVDLLIPFPRTWPHRLLTPIDPSLLLTRAAAQMLCLPYLKALIRRLDHPSTPNFALRHCPHLKDKKLLLIADRYDERLLRTAQRTLKRANPLSVRCLALTKPGEG